MQITQEIRKALDEACHLAPTMRGYTVREDDPVIATGAHGQVIVTLPSASSDLMDVWIGLCRTKTRGTVSTNTQARTISFRP